MAHSRCHAQSVKFQQLRLILIEQKENITPDNWIKIVLEKLRLDRLYATSVNELEYTLFSQQLRNYNNNIIKFLKDSKLL